MSTRSTIIITSDADHLVSRFKTYRLYKHCDGYPTDNLSIIALALRKALRQVNGNNKRFSGTKYPKSEITSEQVAGLIIGEATNEYGMGAVIEETFLKYLTVENVENVLGNQGDLEWFYIVDLKLCEVLVYRTQHGEHVAAYNNGMVDPMIYLEQISEQYKEQEKQKLVKAVNAIKKLGFLI